jgi:Flp pilus assembly protein TadG
MLHKLGRQGVAAAEFAAVAPVLLLLLLGTYDIANSVQTSIHLQRAVRAGAQYAAANSSDMSAIRSRIIAAWPVLTTTDVPLPALICTCAGVTATCNQACAVGQVQTIALTAQRTLSPLLLPVMSRGSGSATVRIR